MLCYNKIDVTERTDIYKTNASKEYDICHYSYLLDIRFRSQSYVFNACHDALVM